MTTTNKVMALAFEYAFRVMEGGWPEDINLQAPLRSAVDTLVAERDALMDRLIDVEYNPFEPSNQSDRYKRLIAERAALKGNP
jgi:hypothetical protein